MRSNELDCVEPLRMLEVPGFRVCEGVYDGGREIPAQPHDCATLCLVVDGGYRMDWRHARLQCGPASLVFHPPGDLYGARIADTGSQCLTVGMEPAVFLGAADTLPDFGSLHVPRRVPPHWLAFQLRRELECADDLSAASVESTVVALLVELAERSGFEARSAPPPWLERVQEQIDDEFRRRHTLESLARTAGVHRVHLAREFHRRFGCTVGHYARQRRIEFACERLLGSSESLSRIAFETGFADQSHFTNTFRRLVGMTPGVFRERFGTDLRRSRARTNANPLQDGVAAAG